MDTVPHMSKIQATQVIARLPMLPILKQEVKKEKLETANVVEIEPVPGTSTEWPAAGAEKTTEKPTEEATVERTTEEEMTNPMKVLWMNISKNICYLEEERTRRKRFKKPVRR